VPHPAFLSEQEKTAAADEVHALAALPSAPRWLGQLAVQWAKAHPDDARVPESLHLAVRAWRYGCTETDQNEAPNYSKEAFEILRARYPASEWTKKTPYWFK
jgi:hypothetical protein